jgi:hypothetical protein
MLTSAATDFFLQLGTGKCHFSSCFKISLVMVQEYIADRSYSC